MIPLQVFFAFAKTVLGILFEFVLCAMCAEGFLFRLWPNFFTSHENVLSELVCCQFSASVDSCQCVHFQSTNCSQPIRLEANGRHHACSCCFTRGCPLIYLSSIMLTLLRVGGGARNRSNSPRTYFLLDQKQSKRREPSR